MIRDVTESNVEAARAFLIAHTDTSLFLLSNLAVHGPHLGESLNSGNYRSIEHDGQMIGVFTLTRRGNLLAETGGRDDLAEEILRSCDSESISIEGVVGEWRAAASLWDRLCANTQFHPTFRSKDVLYRLVLPAAQSQKTFGHVRRLAPADFAQWEPLNTAYLIELGVSPQGTPAQREMFFAGQAAAEHWWGWFEGAALVAVAGLNARYEAVGQVGGVYTLPERRGKGLAREVMLVLQRDAVARHGLQRLVLFTGERNLSARRLYESLRLLVHRRIRALLRIVAREAPQDGSFLSVP